MPTVEGKTNATLQHISELQTKERLQSSAAATLVQQTADAEMIICH